ncbi:MAG: hypothetical protein ACM3YO_00935 [Bacteroidota bacterium]
MANYNLTVGTMVGNLEGQIRELEASAVAVRYFHLGKINNYAKVEGIREYPKGQVPHQHQEYHFDAKGRVVKLEIFDREFSKPTKRYYFYEGDGDNVAESVWFDRYGDLDTVHRYTIDPFSKLMVERSEYTISEQDPEPKLFYTIKSLYDTATNPPQMTEEAWHAANGTPIKRRRYRYDKEGRLAFEEHYNEKNRFEGFYLLTHDSKGNIRKKEWFNSNRKMMRCFEYTYDNQDRVSKIVLKDENSAVRVIQQFIFDAVGAIVEEKLFDSENKLVKHLHY